MRKLSSIMSTLNSSFKVLMNSIFVSHLVHSFIQSQQLNKKWLIFFFNNIFQLNHCETKISLIFKIFFFFESICFVVSEITCFRNRFAHMMQKVETYGFFFLQFIKFTGLCIPAISLLTPSNYIHDTHNKSKLILNGFTRFRTKPIFFFL